MSSPHHTSPEKSKNRESKPTSVHKSRKFMNVTVNFLDGSSHVFQLQAKNYGQALFDKVCKFLDLIEVDYFGLEYEDERGTKCWLDMLKPLCSQISSTFPTMHFLVKFYTPDPLQLEDEFTRYLFGLQMKKDLALGVLQCNDNTAALMISYIVQADFGDYDAKKCADGSYLSGFKFVPYQDTELERKIIENHKKHIGQMPAEADLNLLETARRCELYGIKMTAAKDQEGVPLNLAVAHLGVLVFQNFTKINTFSWAKIRKLSFKRKKFLIKLHPEGYGYYKDTVEFFFEGRNECKNFWKKCIENHTFFRCSDAKQGMRQKPRIFSRGSSFRYSGRTQKQITEYVRENCLKRKPFQRSTSLRTPPSPSRSGGISFSAQPLLPVTSLSCGSISDATKEDIPQKTFSTSEPTTPHVTQDMIRSLNGDYMKTSDQQTSSQGLVSPDFSCEQSGFQSPDFLSQDTDDNISHDSYHVSEKEANKSNCMHTNLTNSDMGGIKENACTNEFDGKHEEIDVKTLTTNDEIDKNGDYVTLINDQESHNNLVTEFHTKKEIEKFENVEKDSAISSNVASENNLNCSNDSNLSKSPISINVHAYIEPIPHKTTDLSIESLNQLSGEYKYQDDQKNSTLSLDEHLEHLKNNSYSDHNNMYAETKQTFGTSTFYVNSSLYPESRINKKKPTDKAYCLAKELLMTERTYRKDLEIINVVFRDTFVKQGNLPANSIELLFTIIDPLYEVHCSLLRELEQRLAFWEGRPKAIQNGIKGVSDVLLHFEGLVNIHKIYREKLPDVLHQLNKDLSNNQHLTQFYEHFESQKLCYLPLTLLLLRPLFRLSYYYSLAKSLIECYEKFHEDYQNSKDLLEKLKGHENIETLVINVINFVKLMELQRSLIGFPTLIQENRKFIREGCLLKFSKNGSHQHMFFLFSDLLLYATRINCDNLHFKVHGQLTTLDMDVEKAEPTLGVTNCLAISNKAKRIIVATYSERERLKWLNDFNKVFEHSKIEQNKLANGSSHCIKSSEEKCDSSDEADDLGLVKEEKPISHHINTSIHVCWHRNISISQKDIITSLKHCMSGYLLRKIKNNSGWQKLWVVLANMCLFFYKTYLDESPLASLPLAGYKVSCASNDDPVKGDRIFKLQYKNHAYYFMVENCHTFERWMDAIYCNTLMEEESTRL